MEKLQFILAFVLGAIGIFITLMTLIIAYIVRFRKEVQYKELCNVKHKALEEINKNRYETLTKKIDLLTGIVLNGGKRIDNKR